MQGLAPSGKPAQPEAHKEAGDFDQALFEALRAKRSELAREANVPPYVIFSDLSLVEMATACRKPSKPLRGSRALAK